MAFSRHLVLILTVIMGMKIAHGATPSSGCALAESTARTACTSNDPLIGTDDPAGVLADLSEITKRGEATRNAASCPTMAARHLNQARLSNALAKVAEAKAKACQKAMNSCRQVCQESNGDADQVTRIFQEAGLDDLAADVSRLAQGDQRNGQACEGFTANVSQATRQADSARNDARSNLRSLEQVSTRSSSSSDAGGATTGSSSDCKFDLNDVADLRQQLGAPDDRAQDGQSPAPVANINESNGGRRPSSTVADSERGRAVEMTTLDNPSAAMQSGNLPRGDMNAELNDVRQAGFVVDMPRAGPTGGGTSPSGGGRSSRFDVSERRLGGFSRSSFDGVTPALGPSLFEKVSRRYQLQAGNLVTD